MKLNKRLLLYIILAVGTIDGLYLGAVSLNSNLLLCATTGIINCHSVLKSVYGTIFGIPTSFFGLAWFVVITVLVFYPINRILRNVWLIFGIGGVVYSITAMSVIGAICIYCTLLDLLIVATILLLIFGKTEKRGN